MAKKTAQTRRTAQRNKPKTQKSIELVHETSTEKEIEVDIDSSPEQASNGVATSTATSTTATPPLLKTQRSTQSAWELGRHSGSSICLSDTKGRRRW